MELESYPGSNTSFNRLFENPDFGFKLFRQLGFSIHGACTLGECIDIARKLQVWDLPGCVQGWAQLAAEVEEIAETSMSKGHVQSACDDYLRAANYFQMAEYQAFISSGNHVHFGLKCQECFQLALALLPWHGETVDLGANNSHIPGYFIAPDDSGTPRPTVAVITGFESSAEELYFIHGLGALRRGYNVLLFQGPGQAGALRYDPASRMRHDYEIPLQVALDFLHDRPEVDRERLALVGQGLGGYFCLRVAAFDPRVKALAVCPPFTDLHKLFAEILGPRMLIVDVHAEALHELPPNLMREDIKLLVLNICRRFGVSRVQAMLQAMEAYTIEDLLYRIHCPVLSVTGPSASGELARQAKQFRDMANPEDHTQLFLSSIHPGDAHNHFSNLPRLNQVIFDWLDERFQKS